MPGEISRSYPGPVNGPCDQCDHDKALHYMDDGVYCTGCPGGLDQQRCVTKSPVTGTP